METQLFAHKVRTKAGLLNILKAYQTAIDQNIVCSITDADGAITYANDHFCRLSQYSREELLGQNHNIVNSGYHSKEFFADLWQTISRGKVWRGEVKSRAKDGTTFWLDSTILPLLNPDGSVFRYFSLRHSIDSKKQFEEQHQTYLNSLKKMLFMTNHEVRHSVVNILGITDMLQNYENTEEETAQLITSIRSAASSLDAFTKKLTAFMYENEQKEKSIQIQ